MDELSEFDLGPLTWVKAEIDNAFEAAASELGRWNGDDLTPLKAAAAYLHQVYGALQIVDLQGVSMVCGEAEALLADMEGKAAMRSREAGELVVKAILALRAYLDALMAGAPNTELALMPIYTDLVVQRTGEPPAPSALFFPDINARAQRPAAELPLDEEAHGRALRASRGKYQKGLLQLLQNRDQAVGLQLMHEAVLEVEVLVPAGAQYTFWWSVAAFLESLRKGTLATDIWVKRLCGRLDMQLRRLAEGSRQLAERLFRDVLYCLAQDGAGQGRAAQVRALFQLDRCLPMAALALPAGDARAAHVGALRDELQTALEHWLRAACGRTDSIEAFRAALQRAAVAAAAAELAPVAALLAAMQAAAQGLGTGAITGNEALQVEMVVAILLARHGTELADARDPAFQEQVRQQAASLPLAVDPDADLTGLEGDAFLSELARQARDKLLLAQVTQAIQANLHEVEEILEGFFRNPEARGDLPLVPGLMTQVQGDFRLLHLDVAADLVQASMAKFHALADAGHEVGQEELNWVADAISTLGLYVEVLRRGRDDPGALRALLAQPGLAPAREASVEEAIQGALAKLKGYAAGLQTAPAAHPVWVEMRGELACLARDADLVGDRGLRAQAEAVLKLLDAESAAPTIAEALGVLTGQKPAAGELAEAGRMVEASAAEVDAELLQIYLEEAREVLGNVDAGLVALRADPMRHDAFVGIRRGFHTLKGSGRMVGLAAPAEIAWEVEQTLNAWLRDERAVDARVLAFIARAAAAFQSWVRELAERGSVQVEGGAIIDEARSLRLAEATPPSDAQPVVAAPPPVEAATPAMATAEPGLHGLPSELFEIFSAEGEQRLAELMRHLKTLGRGAHSQAWEGFTRAAHTLAGIARTTGFADLAEAAQSLEHWSEAGSERNATLPAASGQIVAQAIERLAAMLADIRAGQQPTPVEDLATWLDRAVFAGADLTPAETEVVVDELDVDLLPIFLAEAEDLLPRIGASLRQWRTAPDSAAARQGLQRALHTLKGSARMAGAMRLGDAAHALETRITEWGEAAADGVFLDELEAAYDRLAEGVDACRAPTAPEGASAPAMAAQEGPAAPAEAVPLRQAFKASAALLDTLINQAGEVSIARSRLENVLFHSKMTAQELTANVERLRAQLRELEMQAETQMQARFSTLEASQFDPLEFDRYTRLQELARLMAESVDDVATAQENLLAGLGEAEETLVQQGRMARSLQQELMRSRMVPLDSQAERLHRIVRQAGKELGRSAQLLIEGGQTEVDRSVLDKVLAPLEHLLRNAVAHGIEDADVRLAAGKPAEGSIRLSAGQEGHEFVLVLEDDGVGVDLDKVRRRAQSLGWLKPEEEAGQERLEAFLFMPGFSTAEQVTQLAGRGVGLDVVRSEIASIGGRVRLESEPGRGARFTLRLPISLALTQVVLAIAGNRPFALPANTVVLVKEVKAEAWQAMTDAGYVELERQVYPLRSLAELTGQTAAPLEGRLRTVLLLRSGAERIALRVDRLDGNLEAVVKPIGPQLSRIIGISGVTLLGDGRLALIIDPFILMNRVPLLAPASEAEEEAVTQPPLILVVDDSLTVRKITGRLLHRAGYRVATAKDGVEALEALQDELPAAMLLDIEMPRMDGFEVARHVRADAQTQDLPIIMITSRSAEKHRQHALDLGVNAYMGKPYQDEALLAEIARLIGDIAPT